MFWKIVISAMFVVFDEAIIGSHGWAMTGACMGVYTEVIVMVHAVEVLGSTVRTP